MKIALVYDRVNKIGGAERVLEALHELYPDAPLFTLVHDPSGAGWAAKFQVITSFLQSIPFAKSNHEYLPLLSIFGFERFDFSQYDLVISVTSTEAKGIITSPRTLHVCYLLTPTRYLWSHHDEYFHKRWLRLLASPFVSFMRLWDFIAAQRPDHIIAISETVKKRTKKYYQRESDVIYPPVNLNSIKNQNIKTELQLPKLFFLVVSRLVRYKRINLAIRACNELDIPLYIVGSGRDFGRLKDLAGPQTVFLGNLTDSELSHYYQKAHALIMPQAEDFGIVALEALTYGTPVITYADSGTNEVVKPGLTGESFYPQTENALVAALEKSMKNSYSQASCRESAMKFSKEMFKQHFSKMIDKFLIEFMKQHTNI